MEQRSDEWYNVRLGKVTCSRLIDIMPVARGYKASRANYMAEKVCEILTNEKQDNFVNDAMIRGIELEPVARAVYESLTGELIDEAGFLESTEIPNFGGSPDGLIPSRKSGIEIKCPNTATHISTLTGSKIKHDYILQMHGLMILTGADHWVFFSYDDRLPFELSHYTEIVEYDKTLGEQIKEEVSKFNEELEKLVIQLENIRGNNG